MGAREGGFLVREQSRSGSSVRETGVGGAMNGSRKQDPAHPGPAERRAHGKHTVGREGEQALGRGSLPSSRGGGKGGHKAERVWRGREKLKDPREEGSEKGQGQALRSDWMLGRKDERRKSGRI